MCLLGLFALIYSNNNLLKYAVTLFNTFRSIFVSFVGNIWTLYSFYLFSKFHLTFLFFIQFLKKKKFLLICFCVSFRQDQCHNDQPSSVSSLHQTLFPILFQ